MLALKKQHPGARLVCGNTEVGVEVKFKSMKYPVIVAPTHVPELVSVEVLPGAHLRLGGGAAGPPGRMRAPGLRAPAGVSTLEPDT